MNFEQLNETNCRISDIQKGDRILIGGSFFGKMDLEVIADIEKFEGFFKSVEKNALNFKQNEGVKAWIHQIAPNFDVTAFTHMYAFDNVLRKQYPHLSVHASKRIGFYHQACHRTLSQAVEEGVCQCAEIAILAQVYFQKQKFETKYFGGALLRSPQEEFAEAHSFIFLKTKDGKEFFYDPANPTPYIGVYLPRISSIEATPAQKKQFETKIHIQSERRNCAFLEARDIVTKSNWYYGCGDGAKIFPSFILSKHKLHSPSAKEKSL